MCGIISPNLQFRHKDDLRCVCPKYGRVKLDRCQSLQLFRYDNVRRTRTGVYVGHVVRRGIKRPRPNGGSDIPDMHADRFFCDRDRCAHDQEHEGDCLSSLHLIKRTPAMCRLFPPREKLGTMAMLGSECLFLPPESFHLHHLPPPMGHFRKYVPMLSSTAPQRRRLARKFFPQRQAFGDLFRAPRKQVSQNAIVRQIFSTTLISRFQS